MKKFGKFVFGLATVAAAGAGAYYAYKKFVEKAHLDDEDDFEDDDLDDFELDDDEEAPKAPEYVTINPVKEDVPEEAEAAGEADEAKEE